MGTCLLLGFVVFVLYCVRAITAVLCLLFCFGGVLVALVYCFIVLLYFVCFCMVFVLVVALMRLVSVNSVACSFFLV